jgi:glycosyltransferase involved in cell wall biosynthesis
VRVLLATDWNRGRGGAEAYATWLRDGLVRAGDEVRLLTGSAGTAGDGAADWVAPASERRAAQAFLQIVNPFAVACARAAVREFAPEVALVNMFAHHLSPAFVLALAPVPVVLLVTDYKCVCPLGTKLLPGGTLCTRPAGVACLSAGCVGPLHWLRDRPRYALLRRSLDSATLVVACSEAVRRALAADGIAAQVVDLTAPPPARSYRRAPAGEPTFLFVGRLDVEKGVPLLLRAFAGVRAVVPGARLRVVGRGPLAPELARLTHELALDAAVTFLGWQDPPQVEAELARAWALVAPSLWAEPFGLVALEAVLRGVPVVASASGGFATTVEHGRSGLLFPNGDEGALHEHLLDLATGRAFPEHVLDAAVVDAATVRFALAPHVARLRAVLRDAAGRD